jgi:hypothetical protein
MALTPLYLITAPRLEVAPKKASKSKAKANEAKDEAGDEEQPEAA